MWLQGMSDEGLTVEQFRRRCVEPMGEESDHVHIVALTDALQVGSFWLPLHYHLCPMQCLGHNGHKRLSLAEA